MKPRIVTPINTTAAKADSSYPAATSDYFYWISGEGENYIAYCWHSVEGYSKIGSYEGNGNADHQIPHSMNAVPQMIWVKNRDQDDIWTAGHFGTNGGSSPWIIDYV